MPTIVNAYSGNESIADNMRRLGDAMFGDQAKQELYRQEGEKYRRENEAANALPGLYQSGDTIGLGAQILRHTPTATNIGNVNLARTAQIPGITPDDPRLVAAQAGDKMPYGGTAPGHAATITGENTRNTATIAGENERNKATIANQMAIAHEASLRAAETQKAIADRTLAVERWKTEHTPTTIYDNGQPTIVPQSESFGRRGAPLHKDQVVGGILQDAVNNPGRGASVTDRINAADGGRDPFANLPNDIRHVAGLPSFSATENMNAPGQTSVLPLPPRPTGLPQSATDIDLATGMHGLINRVAPDAINFFTGSIHNPETTDAVNRLEQLINDTRAAAYPGVKDTVQLKKWLGPTLPSTSMLQQGGEVAQHKVFATINALRDKYAEGVQMANDPNIPPEAKSKIVEQLNGLRSLIGRWEQTPGGAAPTSAPPQAGAPAAPAPQQAVPPPQQRQVGQVYQTPKGPFRWNGASWDPAQ